MAVKEICETLLRSALDLDMSRSNYKIRDLRSGEVTRGQLYGGFVKKKIVTFLQEKYDGANATAAHAVAELQTQTFDVENFTVATVNFVFILQNPPPQNPSFKRASRRRRKIFRKRAELLSASAAI